MSYTQTRNIVRCLGQEIKSKVTGRSTSQLEIRDYLIRRGYMGVYIIQKDVERRSGVIDTAGGKSKD